MLSAIGFTVAFLLTLYVGSVLSWIAFTYASKRGRYHGFTARALYLFRNIATHYPKTVLLTVPIVFIGLTTAYMNLGWYALAFLNIYTMAIEIYIVSIVMPKGSDGYSYKF